MTAVLGAGAALVAVLVLAEVSARLWRRRHPTDDRLQRVRQAGVFRGLWMLVVCGVLALLIVTRVVALPR